MPGPNELNLLITGDSASYNKAADSANRATAKLGDSAQRSGDKASKSFEQMALSAGRGAAGINDLSKSLAGAVLSGTLLADGLEGALSKLKEYTVEAAKLAARNETLQVVSQSLARVNGVGEDAVARLVERMKGLNITTQQSYSTVNRLIVAQIDLSKAMGLARLAQD